MELSDNERKIITLLYKRGPLTKHDLARQGNMSWATAVKYVAKFQNLGIIRAAGTSYRAVHKGKNSYVYALTNTFPLAIGIDIEYRTTSMVLTNLSGEILGNVTFNTPANPTTKELRTFLTESIDEFIGGMSEEYGDQIIGIGIGIPGIAIPSWLRGETSHDSVDLVLYLEQHYDTSVVVENNVRAYTVFEQWDKSAFAFDNFILISIRTGVGSGIILNGQLFSGPYHLAGEVGHFVVVDDGRPCRCGMSGCLETVVNNNALYEAYRAEVLSLSVKTGTYSLQDVHAGLNDLFRRAAEGNPAAKSIVERAATWLAVPLAHMIMVLNVPHVIISGDFGEHGTELLQPLEFHIKRVLLPKLDLSLVYYPYDNIGFTRGAALLVLGQYFTANSQFHAELR